ncbi:iron-containing alcohol dehydrogenase [Streptomyces sp. L7]
MNQPVGRAESNLPPLIHYGAGCVAELGALLGSRHLRRVHILTTRSLLGLRRTGGRCSTSSDPTPRSPPCPRTCPLRELMESAARLRSASADALVALGGGSVIDAAKLAALAASDEGIASANPARAKEILASPPSGTVVPVVCLPTTLGGAELRQRRRLHRRRDR